MAYHQTASVKVSSPLSTYSASDRAAEFQQRRFPRRSPASASSPSSSPAAPTLTKLSPWQMTLRQEYRKRIKEGRFEKVAKMRGLVLAGNSDADEQSIEKMISQELVNYRQQLEEQAIPQQEALALEQQLQEELFRGLESDMQEDQRIERFYTEGVCPLCSSSSFTYQSHPFANSGPEGPDCHNELQYHSCSSTMSSEVRGHLMCSHCGFDWPTTLPDMPSFIGSVMDWILLHPCLQLRLVYDDMIGFHVYCLDCNDLFSPP